jgi:hypothetical protein
MSLSQHMLSPDILYDNSGPTTLAEHLWILSKLLVMKDPPSEGGPAAINPGLWFNRLLYYVIATCYPKMERRLGHKISLPYIDSLKVGDVTFNESLRGEPTTREIASDRSFLSEFLPFVKNYLCIPIPHIHEQGKLAAANQDFQLYNKNTCNEFHSLFLELLGRLQTSLTSLKELRNSKNDNGQFTRHVRHAVLIGNGLRKMAKGAALGMHLRTIEAKLVDHRRPDMSMPMQNAEKDEKQSEEQDERDEELEAVQPSALSMKQNVSVPVPLWKSYRNWLNLMVIHFDAVYTLFGYITGPTFDDHRMISLKILVAPPPDRALLPWHELFTDSKLFPTETEADPLPTTNDKILEFLKDPANMTQCTMLLGDVKRFTGTLHCEACLASLLPNDITIDSKHKDILEQMKVRYVVSGWFYQQLIISDDRVMDELLAYQNVAARRVDTFSRS